MLQKQKITRAPDLSQVPASILSQAKYHTQLVKHKVHRSCCFRSDMPSSGMICRSQLKHLVTGVTGRRQESQDDDDTNLDSLTFELNDSI